ncbi:MAG TPA: cobalamin-independent methionine synthase II family protein [Verrucomicrobiales bacterium]|nr:cobalamin-independent methionine synthase II family protein [Verrucomicrobiales bacterium]
MASLPPGPPPSLPAKPEILTSTVGSYPIPSWLKGQPSSEALLDAACVVFHAQRRAGIDLPTDGELSRFDADHPDTNGMIDYFTNRLDGVKTRVGRSIVESFRKQQSLRFRARPAGLVAAPLGEGALDLPEDCRRASSVAGGPFKFTVTSPYMLARTLLDHHYNSLESLSLALAGIFADQVRDLPCACLQVDEAHLPGHPGHGPLAAESINRVLDAFTGPTAVHLCFGNYGGQTIQSGSWTALLDFFNSLRAGHLVMELARRPASDLGALRDVRPEIALGIGVIDIKSNRIETEDEIARSIERATAVLGPGRVRFVHPDCGFWMLNRSVADRKMAALSAGRDRFLGLQHDALYDTTTA